WVTVSLRTWTSFTSAASIWRSRPNATAVTITPKISVTATVIRTRTEPMMRRKVTSTPAGSVGGSCRGGDGAADPVALPTHRLEVAPTERAVDLASEVADVDLHHVGVAVEVGA